MSRHISIDTEYLDHKPSGVVLTLGMVEFFPELGTIGDKILLKLSIDEQTNRTRNQDTIDWWAQQSLEARKEAFNGERISLDEARVAIIDFCATADGVWGFGSYADNAKIRDLFGEEVWHYRVDRCGRTLVDLAKLPKEPFQGKVEHSAVDDAFNQAHMYMRAMQKLGVYV